jgi:quinol-cytochrome oxidoreductase complex cytochrome b subunit
LTIYSYRLIYRILVYIFIGDVLMLGWLGGQAPVEIYVTLSYTVLTPLYFLFFFAVGALTRLHRRIMECPYTS